ncbi:MAG: putative 4-hydroxy-4-methyl-2-oxoglutarate aldolase [Pseudomonadales bacterium]
MQQIQDLLPEICDHYEAQVRILTPMLTNFGAKPVFWGEIVTVKAFEDNSLVREQVSTDGRGKVLVVDGGGSRRRAMLGDMLAQKAEDNGWEGIIINGSIRDVDVIGQTPVGVQALGAHPLKTEKRGLGDLNVTVTFGGVDFVPGQFVYADNNGALVSETALDLTSILAQ